MKDKQKLEARQSKATKPCLAAEHQFSKPGNPGMDYQSIELPAVPNTVGTPT